MAARATSELTVSWRPTQAGWDGNHYWGGASTPLIKIGDRLLRRERASAISSTRHQPRSIHDEYPHTTPGSSRWSTFGDTTKKCVACSMYAGIELTALIRSSDVAVNLEEVAVQSQMV